MDKFDVLKRIFILLTILIGTFSPIKHCFAQNEFRHYSSDEGFTESAWKTIVQDSLGFLWISSNSLLFKFDGFVFTPYKVPVNLLTLSGIYSRVLLDPGGRVWISSTNSISFFDRNSEKFTSYQLPIDGLMPETVWFEGSDNIWIGAKGKGLINFVPSTRESRIYKNNDGHSWQMSEINTVRSIEKVDDCLLLGTDRGLWKFNKETKSFTRPTAEPSDTALIYSVEVRKIFYSQDKYWLWTDQQLVQLDSRFSLLHTLEFDIIHKEFDLEKKFDSIIVSSVERDASGIFWIALQGLGLIRYDPSNGQLLNFRHDPNVAQSLPSDVLHHVMIDRDQNVWISTIGKGIAQLKRRSITFYNYLPGVSTTGIAIVKTKHSSNLVTASNGSGLWITPIDTTPHDLNFQRLDLGNIKGFESSIEVTMGSERLWIGSLTSGIVGLRVDKQTGRIDPASASLLQHDDNNVNTISENFITSLIEDTRGHLWAGTFRFGMNDIDLAIDHGRPGSVYRYNKSMSDTAFQDHTPDVILEDDHNILVATSRGLYRINPSTRDAERISEDIPCDKVLRASDGTLYVAAKTGLLEGLKTASGHYTFKPAPLPGSPIVTSLLEDRLGRIWCTSFQGIFFYDKRKQRISQTSQHN